MLCSLLGVGSPYMEPLFDINDGSGNHDNKNLEARDTLPDLSFVVTHKLLRSGANSSRTPDHVKIPVPLAKHDHESIDRIISPSRLDIIPVNVSIAIPRWRSNRPARRSRLLREPLQNQPDFVSHRNIPSCTPGELQRRRKLLYRPIFHTREALAAYWRVAR